MDRTINSLLNMPATRRQPQQKRSVEKLNRILDAATLLMSKSGEQKLTTSLIAYTAGIAVGSIYQFYSNVEEIKEALLLRVLSRIPMVFQKVIDEMPEDASVKDVYHALIDTAVDLPTSFPVMVKVITSGISNKEFYTAKYKADRAQLDILIKIVLDKTPSARYEEVRRWLSTLILIADTMTFKVWTAKSEECRQQHIHDWKGITNYFLEENNI